MFVCMVIDCLLTRKETVRAGHFFFIIFIPPVPKHLVEAL